MTNTTHGLYINGVYAKSAGEESSIRNPATGEEIARASRDGGISAAYVTPE